eukprot:2164647-Amphidinium_carterae.1
MLTNTLCSTSYGHEFLSGIISLTVHDVIVQEDTKRAQALEKLNFDCLSQVVRITQAVKPVHAELVSVTEINSAVVFP